MKKLYWVLIIALLAVGVLFFILRGNEDSWIKDSNGSYVKHGMPAETPDYVIDQQIAVLQALELYNRKKAEGMVFSSQCLGTVGEEVKYVVDIVHVPRTEEDNRAENQCEDYRTGKASHFIELDKDGNFFRIL